MVYLIHSLAGEKPDARQQYDATEKGYHKLARDIRSQSRKIRDFFSQQGEIDIDKAVWEVIKVLCGGAPELLVEILHRKVTLIGPEQDFWRIGKDVSEIESHPMLPRMFLLIVAEFYRRMLEDLLVSASEAYEDDELASMTQNGDFEYDDIIGGRGAIHDLLELLSLIAWRRDVDAEAYLEDLRRAPSSELGPGAQEVQEVKVTSEEGRKMVCRRAYASAYLHVNRALYSLVRYLCRENCASHDELRYLYRDPETGRPEGFRHGRSDVSSSPCASGDQVPLAIVVDRRGVLFCRSTRIRQRAFQYRNAVIRELANIHAMLRPVKMSEIARITAACKARMAQQGSTENPVEE